MTRRALTVRFSMLYFFAFTIVSATLTFFPIHCEAIGESKELIALMSAFSNVGLLFGAPFASKLAHGRLGPRRVLLSTSFFAAFISVLLLWAHGTVALFLTFFLVMALNSGTIALVDAQAIVEGRRGNLTFETVRAWGSVGFIAATLVIGMLYDRMGVRIVVPSMILTFAATAFAVFPLRGRWRAEVEPVSSDAAAPVRRSGRLTITRPMWILFGVVSLGWIAQGPLYVYLSIYLRSLGWSGTMVSIAWNVGVVAEIVLFFLFRAIAARFSFTSIIRFSLAMGLVRWGITAFTHDEYLILFAQSLHAFTYGSFYLATMKALHEIVPEEERGLAQGVYNGYVVGGGSLAGRLLAGYGAGFVATGIELSNLFMLSMAFTAASLAASLLLPPSRRADPAA